MIASGRLDFRKRLLAGSAWITAVQLISKFSLFVVGAILSRIINVSIFGEFMAFQGAVILGVAIADRGLSLSIERDAATGGVTYSHIRVLIRVRAFESVFAAIISIVILSVTLRNSLGLATVCFMSAAGASIFVYSISSSLLNAAQNFRSSAAALSAGRIVYVLLTFLLSLLTHSVVCGAAAWASGELVTRNPTASLRSQCFAETLGLNTLQRTTFCLYIKKPCRTGWLWSRFSLTIVQTR